MSRDVAMDEEWCYRVLRRCRWPDGVTCPRCASRRVTVHTRWLRTPRRRYLCLDCRRTFTDLTGTMFARSKVPLGKWLLALSLLPSQLSTVECARALSLKWETAARMSRALLGAAARPGLVRDLRAALGGAPGATRAG